MEHPDDICAVFSSVRSRALAVHPGTMTNAPPTAAELQDVPINSDAIAKVEKADKDDTATEQEGNARSYASDTKRTQLRGEGAVWSQKAPPASCSPQHEHAHA
jgi:hypothetical protein